MAPEQASGAAATHASDLYALAAIVYRAITGQPAVRRRRDRRDAVSRRPHAAARGRAISRRFPTRSISCSRSAWRARRRAVRDRRRIRRGARGRVRTGAAAEARRRGRALDRCRRVGAEPPPVDGTDANRALPPTHEVRERRHAGTLRLSGAPGPFALGASRRARDAPCCGLDREPGRRWPRLRSIAVAADRDAPHGLRGASVAAIDVSKHAPTPARRSRAVRPALCRTALVHRGCRDDSWSAVSLVPAAE